MTPPLTTIHIEVLTAIKRKEKSCDTLTFMKSDMNIKNSNKFYFFHHDHGYDNKKCLEKKT